MTDKGIVYFDPMESKLPAPMDDKRYGLKEGPLAWSYSPDASGRHTFSWVVENKADSYALFRIELYGDVQDKDPIDFIYEWGPTCELASLQKKEGQR
jgi:hypothetical protein